MRTLKIGSCMAPNMEPMAIGLGEWLGEQLGVPVEYMHELDWQGRERAFERGDIDLLWLCGLPYVLKADGPDQSARLVAAPVMAADRYQGQPVYFSEILVSSEAGYRTFTDLADTRWGINEPGSHSGYNLARWFLATQGLDWNYFSAVVMTGSHERTLSQLMSGDIDGAAVDSTVWEQALRQQPELERHLVSIETLGPSPIPPWVAGKHVEEAFRITIAQSLQQMHTDPAGRQVLELAGISHMTEVSDQDYDSLREMVQIASAVPPPESVVD